TVPPPPLVTASTASDTGGGPVLLRQFAVGGKGLQSGRGGLAYAFLLIAGRPAKGRDRRFRRRADRAQRLGGPGADGDVLVLEGVGQGRHRVRASPRQRRDGPRAGLRLEPAAGAARPLTAGSGGRTLGRWRAAPEAGPCPPRPTFRPTTP